MDNSIFSILLMRFY